MTASDGGFLLSKSRERPLGGPGLRVGRGGCPPGAWRELLRPDIFGGRFEEVGKDVNVEITACLPGRYVAMLWKAQSQVIMIVVEFVIRTQ